MQLGYIVGLWQLALQIIPPGPCSQSKNGPKKLMVIAVASLGCW
jgi:hypothetical protein